MEGTLESRHSDEKFNEYLNPKRYERTQSDIYVVFG